MKSYLKFLSRNKLYTAIEAVGLIVSLAFVILIGSYAWQQYAVTIENQSRKQIYTFGISNGIGLTYGFTDALAERMPEVEKTVRYSSNQGNVPIELGDRYTEAYTIAVESDFFRMFSYYKILEGTLESIDAATNVFVSESFARKNDIHLGETLRVDEQDYNITGIVADFKNTIFPYTDLIFNQRSPFNETAWGTPFDHYGAVIPFVQFAEETNVNVIRQKTEAICKEIYPNVFGESFFENLEIIRLDDLFFSELNTQLEKGDKNTLRLLCLAGLLLLLSAIFNYINLTFALTGKRAKEMATRRLLGEDRMAIIFKQITESVAFTAICFAISLLLAYALAPFFNQLLNDPDIPINVQLRPSYLAIYVLLVLGTGVNAGLFPALLAGRYNPIDVVRGNFRRQTKMTFSKVFITFQNILAVFLIAMALIMEAQYKLSLNRPMHANTNGIYYLMIRSDIQSQEPLRNALEALPDVQHVGFSQGVPGLVPGGQYSTTTNGDEILYRTFRMDSTAFKILNFEVIKDYHTPLYGGVWFGERSFAATGLSDDYLDISDLKKRTGNIEQVAGVIADFPLNNTNVGKEDYLYVHVLPREKMFFGGWVIQTTGETKEVKKAIIDTYEKWCKDNPGVVMQSGFIKDYFKDGMKPALNNMRLLEVFMLLAILISLLGLLAMSTYYADERSKDIAVRKVFGSTMDSELWHSVREYMILVGMACIIGIPMAVWAAQQYLENYIYRLENYGWIFIVAIVISVAIAFGSVLWQTLKAARTNPATELKKE